MSRAQTLFAMLQKLAQSQGLRFYTADAPVPGLLLTLGRIHHEPVMQKTLFDFDLTYTTFYVGQKEEVVVEERLYEAFLTSKKEDLSLRLQKNPATLVDGQGQRQRTWSFQGMLYHLS